MLNGALPLARIFNNIISYPLFILGNNSFISTFNFALLSTYTTDGIDNTQQTLF